MLSVVPRSQLWVCPVLQIRSSEKDIYSTEASQPIELGSLCIHLSLGLSACSQHLYSILAFSALGWSPIPLFVCFLVHPVEIFPWSLTWSAFIVPLVPPLQTWLALFFCGCPEVVMNAIVSYGMCVLGDTGISPSLESALLPLLPAGLCPPALWDASGFPENSGMWDSGQQAAGSRKRKKKLKSDTWFYYFFGYWLCKLVFRFVFREAEEPLPHGAKVRIRANREVTNSNNRSQHQYKSRARID